MIKSYNKQEIKRWAKLKDHPVQNALVRDRHRFKVIPAGRRSGKTERFKRFVVKEAFSNPGRMYFAGAPTRDQAKRIFWNDLKLLSFSSIHKKKPLETDLIITCPNEATIHVIGFDKPQRFEGQPWAGGGVDESGNIKADAWDANIFPALDTEDLMYPGDEPWLWIFGVPEGLNKYYDLAQYAKNSDDPEWKFYHWKSSDILSKKRIAAAKRRMSTKQFRQEYEASFETATGRIYEDYSKDNHTKEQIRPHEKIMWCHDQNFTPLSSAICVLRKTKIPKRDKFGLVIVGEYEEVDAIFALDEIVLSSAISKQSAVEFVDRYKDHMNKTVYIYGDPAGRAGEKHGHASDYTEMEDILRNNGWEFKRKVKRAAPAIRDRQNSLRALVCNAFGDRRLFVNTAKAVYCDKGLSTVQTKKGSAFQEDHDNEYQHITTALGYMVDYEYPISTYVGDVPFTFTN